MPVQTRLQKQKQEQENVPIPMVRINHIHLFKCIQKNKTTSVYVSTLQYIKELELEVGDTVSLRDFPSDLSYINIGKVKAINGTQVVVEESD
jgi:hypothetical protein